MRPAVKLLLMTFLTLFLAGTLFHQPVTAQGGSASDLINAVNQLRQNQGLAPYSVDSFLMGFAQSQSDYMASIGRWTHTRADGTTANDHGVKENVAMGNNMSIQYCIYTVWSDWVHWQTMTAYEAGRVGAGVSVVDGTVYYTLNVIPEGGTLQQPAPSSNRGAQNIQNQPIIISQLVTSTPEQDGTIIHIVQYGETLWTISEAYDVPIDQILTNSGLSQGTTQVFEDQRLIIQTASEPTLTPTFTATLEPGTPTPTQARPTMTPRPTRTPAPTSTPTLPYSVVHQILGNGKNVGLGLILVSGLGLILVIYIGFIKQR